jgi:hypothetical protein
MRHIGHGQIFVHSSEPGRIGRLAQQLFSGLAVAAGALVIAAASPAVARAQTGKITGVVTDAANGRPVEGVQVVLQGTGRGAVTTSNGRYFILSVPPGTYTVTRAGSATRRPSGAACSWASTRRTSQLLDHERAGQLGAVEDRGRRNACSTTGDKGGGGGGGGGIFD